MKGVETDISALPFSCPTPSRSSSRTARYARRSGTHVPQRRVWKRNAGIHGSRLSRGAQRARQALGRDDNREALLGRTSSALRAPSAAAARRLGGGGRRGGIL